MKMTIWKVTAIGAATAIGIATLALVLGSRPAEEATTTAPAAATEPAEGPDAIPRLVAMGFIDAYGAFDFEEAVSFLADDADISELIGAVGDHSRMGTLADFRLLLSLLEVQGYQQTQRSCQELGSSTAESTTLRCRFDFHTIRSEELGRGPFSGSYFLLTVRDGKIVEASKTFAIEEFSPQVWEPFAAWVSKRYPEDAAVMYTDSGQRVSEASIRLWEKRTREYVELETPRMAKVAERFMRARDAHDAERAMSLLAGDGATVRFLWGNGLYPHMPAVRMSRRQLALALEAERLLGARYTSVLCRREPVWGAERQAQVLCTYRLDNRLRQIAGYRPEKASLGIGVLNGRVDYLSFPWLNVSWGPGGYGPAEAERFVRWLGAAHPEEIDIDHPYQGGGTLFRSAGQEWILKLNRRTLDLLARYLEEYERSANG